MAPPSKKSSRPRSTGSRPGGGNPKQSGPVSRPWRYLAVLAALIIAMLAGVAGSFKVGLGLDLSSGTAITIKAVAPHGTPTAAEMSQSIAILISRVNGQGFTGATVRQQGTNYIVVSVPGKSAQDISPLLSSAVLRFRQVLLTAPGYPVTLPVTPPTNPSANPSPAPSGSPSPGASPSSSPKAAGSPSASPSPAASAHVSTPASPKPSASAKAAGGTGQATGSRLLAGGGQASPSPSASAKTSPSASPSASPSPSGSPSPSPSVATTTRLPTATDASGDITKVTNPAVIKDFNRLNCHNKNWQAQIYQNNPRKYDAPGSQIVACDKQGFKYVLDVAKVLGTNLRNVSAGIDQQNGQWVVNFGLDGPGQKAFAVLTTEMNQKYFNQTTQQMTSQLDRFAIVLDGNVISAPQVNSPIVAGQGQITGNFNSKSANDLAAVLKYGAVPLAFLPQSTTFVSAQLGSAHLEAGLIAAAIGLALVVVYSFLYYRGLAVVSVFSLATAALLSWLAVILLSKYEGFTLSLAGVAGLIVAIGITADSFVVYFERLRDEVREGRSLRAAVERGWERARRTILVSDTVSFLAALLLYIIAIGDVRGFAFTLGLTTLIDIVVVFLFTKPMVSLLARTSFYGRGHKWSGLDPARLGAKSPWRGSRPATAQPAAGASASTARTTPKEA
ncbi:MAG TPA: protein translocase subunit SecD [Streptosporangiaceae bacterium]